MLKNIQYGLLLILLLVVKRRFFVFLLLGTKQKQQIQQITFKIKQIKNIMKIINFKWMH